jgi:hypothetical protein
MCLATDHFPLDVAQEVGLLPQRLEGPIQPPLGVLARLSLFEPHPLAVLGLPVRVLDRPIQLTLRDQSSGQDQPAEQE